MIILADDDVVTASDAFIASIADAIRAYLDESMADLGVDTTTTNARRFIEGMSEIATEALVVEMNKVIDDMMTAGAQAKEKFENYAGLVIQPIDIYEEDEV